MTGLRSFARLALAAAALMATAALAQPADRPWLEDYRLLKARLEADYANLAWYGSPAGGVDLPRLDRRTTSALAAATNEEEARFAIRTFVEAFHDGHFSLLPDPPSGEASTAPEPAARDLSGEDAVEACAALGYGSRSQIFFSLPFESLPSFDLVDDGVQTSFRLGIVHAGARTIGVLRIRNFGPTQYPAACIAAWTAADAAERVDSERFDERVQERWLASLADSLRLLRARGAELLLVDVGTNSGGNESGDWATRLLTSRPLRSAPLLMTAGPRAALYLDQETEALTNVIGQVTDARAREMGRQGLTTLARRKAAIAGAACNLHWVWTERRPWQPRACARLVDVGFGSGILAYAEPGTIADPRIARRLYWPSVADPYRGSWAGPVYVLTNGATYSAAEMFAAVLQDNRAARTIGTRTGGDGCGFMVEADPFVLPTLRMRMRMPNCVRLRADGRDEVAGIEPDIPLPAVPGESPRGRAARLLARIVEDGNAAPTH